MTHETEIRITAIVVKEFENFIDSKTFTQSKLTQFETELKKKLDSILSGNVTHDAEGA